MLSSMPASPALVVTIPKKVRHRKKEDDTVLQRPLPQRIPKRSRLLEPAPLHRTYRNYKKSKSK